MLNFPTFEHFDGLSADTALEPHAQAIEAAVRGVFPGARFYCIPSRFKIGPPPYGLELLFTFGVDKSEYGNGIVQNDPLFHQGSVVSLRDGSGRVEVDFAVGTYLRYGAGERVKFGWRKTKCMPGQVAGKLAAYFTNVRRVFLEHLAMMPDARAIAVKRGMVSESLAPVNEARGARGRAVGPMLEFANNYDVPEIAALLKSDVDDAGASAALEKMGASPREARAVLKHRGYFTGGGYDADMARLSRAVGDKHLHAAIAKDFAAGVLRYIGRANMAKVVELNKTYGEGSCASHDFCDANVFMDRAFGKNGFDSDDWRDFAALNDWSDLWGAAWEAAKSSDFFFKG